jgi:hypothetical protein
VCDLVFVSLVLFFTSRASVGYARLGAQRRESSWAHTVGSRVRRSATGASDLPKPPPLPESVSLICQTVPLLKQTPHRRRPLRNPPGLFLKIAAL